MNATEDALHLDKFAIYLRKSRNDRNVEGQTDEEVLERHKKILTDLAARRGLYIEHIYHEVVSGETIKDRPEIQKLINDCYAGKYKGILVVEVTRLSRGSQGDAQIIMDCLKYSNHNSGVLIVTPTKTYDIAHNDDDSEFLEFELFMSRREYKMIKKRMERGRVQAVIEGNYMGSYRPYGYDILKSKKTRTLQPNPEEAPIVQKIFEWTVKDNLTPGTIARRLTKMAVPTYSGDPEWSIPTIKTILTNPTYCGKVKWNDRMQVKTLVDGQLVTSRPRSNHTDLYMEVDGLHKKHALVDEETFRLASQRFHSDKTKAGYKLRNPLAGLLVCKNCGKTMVHQVHRQNTPSRYNHKSSQLCKVKSATVDDVLNAVVHSLKLYLEDFELKVDNLPDVDENTILGQIEALEQGIKKSKKALSKLFDGWTAELISDNEFVEEKAKHNAKISAIKAEIAELENTIPEKEDYQEMVVKLSDALEALLDKDLDADIKNEYLKQIIDKIEYSRENNDEFILDIHLR